MTLNYSAIVSIVAHRQGFVIIDKEAIIFKVNRVSGARKQNVRFIQMKLIRDLTRTRSQKERSP